MAKAPKSVPVYINIKVMVEKSIKFVVIWVLEAILGLKSTYVAYTVCS